MTDDVDEGHAGSAAITSFDLVNAVEVISISVFITGGAFLAAAALVGVLGSEPAIQSVQFAMAGTGGGLAAIGVFIRWLLGRYG